MAFPVDKQNERCFEPAWCGEVFVCDIDRTYLATRFSSLFFGTIAAILSTVSWE